MSINLSGQCILVVEDEPAIVMEISAALRAANASVLTSTTLSEGLRLAEEPALSVAVIDLALGSDKALALCRRLTERGVPFVIHSGYAEVPVEYEPYAVVPKPAGSKAIVEAVAAAVRGRTAAPGGCA